MKIIGLTYYEGQYRMAMKSDSSLLNQGKPFFLPAWSEDVWMQRCMVVRICRLGRSIEPRFASRYYDAVAEGIDFIAANEWHKGNITEAIAFDGSLCVGEWLTAEQWIEWLLSDQHQPTILSIEDAIAQISQIMTLRMGDLIYLDYAIPAQKAEREMVITYRQSDNSPLLYCKIK